MWRYFFIKGVMAISNMLYDFGMSNGPIAYEFIFIGLGFIVIVRTSGKNEREKKKEYCRVFHSA